ncbi:hypothetical protein [Bradyrhizobium sp. LHD-71]|uniref:hypothetical protein n=1 Tax=Bradyrhizobium sp. LHD-71 TaxID=3072141 RepID=UPI00280F1457|nr:hypothetical protein [Bradyrhizobium sp. LHD-71]MDQ8729157.1 hypothetical protein [Bradyrhizobium sp. LHD-71]
MSERDAELLDVSGHKPEGPAFWHPLKVAKEVIEREIQRLSDAPRPEDGRRSSLIVHPCSKAPGLGLAPGIDVTINVLNPGESTRPIRRNSNQVEICIRGAGRVTVGEQKLRLEQWDVCNIPSMRAYFHTNDGDDVWVRLTYSNAPLLAKLGIHYSEENPVEHDRKKGAGANVEQSQRYVRDTAPDVPILESGARLRGYEFLTDIEVVENKAYVWPFELVSPYLATRPGDNKRGIMLFYNPATERRNGTTHSFFTTISSTPPGMQPRPIGPGHRHSSVAINYHYKGSGKSIVGDHIIEWQAGDLLLSAPGWMEHAHYFGPEGAGAFTVQDHPLQIGMESLIWQERMDGPILTLGSDAGQVGYVGPRVAGQ